MREIKFRVWDKLDDRMKYLTTGHDALFFGSGVARYTNLQNGSGGDEYALMQFTGLRDKNGKEIYEGDVILRPVPATEWNEKHFGINSETMEKAVIYWNEENAGFEERFRPSISMHPCFQVVRLCDEEASIEIIGNIHENPELLEAKP